MTLAEQLRAEARATQLVDANFTVAGALMNKAAAIADQHDARVSELLEANNREVERRRVMAAVLRECRDDFADTIEADLHYACPVIDGVPDESQLDEAFVPIVAARRALIAKIDAALEVRQACTHDDPYHTGYCIRCGAQLSDMEGRSDGR